MNISDAHSFCLQLSEIVRQKNEVNFTKIFNPEELDDNEYNTLVTNLNSLVCKIENGFIKPVFCFTKILFLYLYLYYC